MYRINYMAVKDNDGIGFHVRGWQEVPWLWLAKLKVKMWIRSDERIFEAYIEDVSPRHFDTRRCIGKTVWEWKREKD